MAAAMASVSAAPLNSTLGLSMQEHEFISNIDCCFPYRRSMEWRRIVAQAPGISANAAFMVIHELCRPPRSVNLTEEHARLILSRLRCRFKHPLLHTLEPAISAHFKGKLLPVQKAAYLMRQVGKYRGQYNALSICYFSADDKTGVLEPIYDQIVSSWARANREAAK